MGAHRSRSYLLLLSLFLLHHHVGAHSASSEDSGSGTVDLKAKSLINVKIYCLVILLVSTFAAGISPYFFRWNESFLLLGTQFAGGVFFGTALIHFLADANSTEQDLTDNPYPVVFMLACVGYLITMLGDVIIQSVLERTRKNRKVDSAMVKEGGTIIGAQNIQEIHMEIHPAFVRADTVGDSILLILALCFHSVFEGIAVGVADTRANAWKNLWTISLHKIFAAIAMGIALLRMLPKKPLLLTAAYSFAFAISSPVGVGIGIAIDATTQGPVADWVFVVSMGIATGVFIYVAVNHLIAKGFKPQEPNYFDTPFYRLLAITLGVATIAVVLIWDA